MYEDTRGGFLYCKQQLPYCGSWLPGDQNTAGDFSTGADKISFPGPRRVDGVASNSQHVKSLGVQIAEQGRRFFSETKYPCFLYAGLFHVLLLSVSERTPQMWNLLVQRAQNKTGGCPGQLVAQAVLFVSPPKRATFFLLQILKPCSFCCSLYLCRF